MQRSLRSLIFVMLLALVLRPQASFAVVGASCSSDSECDATAGETCNLNAGSCQKTVVDGCTSNDQCQNNQVCNSTQNCIPAPGGAPQSCSTTPDCGASGVICGGYDTHTCVPGQEQCLDGCSCSDNSDCTGAEVCIGNVCRPPEATTGCDTSSGCPDGQVCNLSTNTCQAGTPDSSGGGITPTPTTTTPTGTGKVTSLQNPLGGTTTIQGAIGAIVKLIIGLVGTGALLMFVWGGIRFITARGNDKEIGAAKEIITWSVFGLAVVFLAYAIVTFLVQALSSTGAA